MPRNPAYLTVSRKALKKIWQLEHILFVVVVGFKPKDIKCEHGIVFSLLQGGKSFNFEDIAWCLVVCVSDTSSAHLWGWKIQWKVGPVAATGWIESNAIKKLNNWTASFKWLFQRHGPALDDDVVTLRVLDVIVLTTTIIIQDRSVQVAYMQL